MAEKTYFCEKCKKTMKADMFYTSNNLQKYPNDGKLHQCKKCLTMHVDNWNADTYLWILQEIDVPYVPEEWNKLLASYGKDPSKLTGMSIVGRYLSKMKLNQWNKYRWADTEHLQAVANKRVTEAMLQQGHSMSEIDDTLAEINTSAVVAPPPPPAQLDSAWDSPSPFSQQVEDTMVADLTDEDRLYLCLKWGKTYRPDEWIRLEEFYEQMINSYDIQSAGDINTLKLACKSSLKANQLMDLGDIDGAQKATKMYESMMKAGKWTAQQNKEEGNDAIDSIGELVAICERDGFIPKFYIDAPKDKADRVLQDMQKYTQDLVANESGLSVMMERAVAQIEEEEARIKAAAEAGDDADEEAMFNYEKPAFELEDYSEFKDFEAELSEEDDEYIQSLLEGDVE